MIVFVIIETMYYCLLSYIFVYYVIYKCLAVVI